MADFPTSVPTITRVVDGSTKVTQIDPNKIMDELEAALEFLGESGAAQSHNTDLLAQIFTLKPTILLSYVSATQISASAGVSRVQNAAGSIRKLRRNTSSTTITPTLGASTSYLVYGIGDAAATTVTFEVKAVGAAVTGTNYELIGGFSTNASSQIIESTVWSVGGSHVYKPQRYQTGDVATGTTAIPFDDSIPQNTEGNQFLSIDYQPHKTTNLLQIDVFIVLGANASGSNRIAVALFQDSTADALAAIASAINSSLHYPFIFAFRHFMLAGTNQKTTFKVRAGHDGSGTVTMNGQNTSRLFGGRMASSITVTEFEV